MEIWKDSHVFGDIYQISNKGALRSKTRIVNASFGSTRTVNGRVLKAQVTHHGYMIADLKKGDERVGIFIHRLVAFAFIPECRGKDFVNHIDGNKQNNCAENLEWCTRSENMRHAFDTGLLKSHVKPGETSPRAILKDADVLSIKDRLNSGEKAPAIAKEYGLSRHTIYAIKNGKNWSHLSTS